MKKLQLTLKDIKEIFDKEGIDSVLTRFNFAKEIDPDDLDILVKKRFFKKTISLFEKEGYKKLSHDQALGGRISGMQMNLVKNGRIKIDLHKDFTWRKQRYFDSDIIWKSTRKVKIKGGEVVVPAKEIDAFLVLINVIFEKTYITKDEFDIFWQAKDEVFREVVFQQQASKYGWSKTFTKFENWAKGPRKGFGFPVFLPVSLVLYSYWEKFLHELRIDLISLLYYFLFRIRFFLNKKLPYD